MLRTWWLPVPPADVSAQCMTINGNNQKAGPSCDSGQGLSDVPNEAIKSCSEDERTARGYADLVAQQREDMIQTGQKVSLMICLNGSRKNADLNIIVKPMSVAP